MNSVGKCLRLSIFGESHGETVGVSIDGVPAGMPLCVDDFAADLERRRSCGTDGTTPRTEADVPHIVSGVYRDRATGAPVTVVFRNGNVRSGDYAAFRDIPRPSHADLIAAVKYGGFSDPRGGGRFSGRMTLALVAAGVVAKKILAGASFSTRVVAVGGESDPDRFREVLDAAVRDGDSVGGVVEVTASGIPTGLGEPFFDSVESVASHLIFSIPGVKGVEFGAGFAAASARGSVNNDPIVDAAGRTATNNDGGINGGIANGNPIVVRAAFRPTASISRPQCTFDFAAGQTRELRIAGRHDACIALRGAVVVEAALAVALADLLLAGGRVCRGE